MSLKINNLENYYSKRLDANDHRIYLAAVDALSKGIYSVGCPGVMDVSRTLDAVLTAVNYGCPELFNQSGSATIRGSEMTFDARYPGKGIQPMQEEIDEVAEAFLYEAESLETDEERILAVNDFLCRNVRYTDNPDVAYGGMYAALVLGQARCEGIAKAAAYLFDLMGMESILCNGTVEDNVDHLWNMVWCDGAPYHFDFTWNINFTVNGMASMIYTFLGDETCELEHNPIHPYPECSDYSKEYWARHNGEVRYFSDLCNVDVLEVEEGYYALARFSEPLTQDEIDNDVFDWARDELNGYGFGSHIGASYREKLKVLQFNFYDSVDE